MAVVGTGITITFSSSFFAEILEVTGPSASRVSIQTSHMGTVGNHTFTPGDLVDWGELSVSIAFNPVTDPPIGSAPETVTITWPNSGTATWAFTGFMIGFTPKGPLEDRCTADCTIKVSGDVTVTP